MLAYAIFRRANTGSFTKSSRRAKATAAVSVPATNETGSGVMANPLTANDEAIRMSATEVNIMQMKLLLKKEF